MRLFPIPYTLYAIPLFFCLPALADGTINIAQPDSGSGWTVSGNVVTITANGNYTVTGSSTTNRVVINKNVTATVTLQNANIHSADASPFMLSSDTIAGGRGSQVTLILSGSNELVTTEILSAGLTVEDSAQITIEGAGSLLAQGGGKNPFGGAGIGGGGYKAAGAIIIKSGTVTAIGGHASAGIGGGCRGGSGSNFTITGGTITATSGEYAAGIGGGSDGGSGNITVTGGMITATSRREGAGIGGGRRGNGESITVTGGTITATSESMGAGIGGGALGKSGIITVTGGMINATGGGYAAGIGGGYLGNSGSITITGGMINAIGGVAASATGGGYGTDGGRITISGGTIVATTLGGTGDPAAIGGGGMGSAGTINIAGGTVYASSGTGAGIGGGNGTGGGTITITGGAVIADAIGIGAKSRTQTTISGAKTLVLSPSINTATFGEATVCRQVRVNINSGPNTDVTLNENVSIPAGALLNVPDGIILNVNNYVLHNGGIIRKFGAINNADYMTGNAPVGPIQASWISDVAAYPWSGSAITPAVTVKDGDLTLTAGVYYSVSYENNSNAGAASVVVTDLGDYHTVSRTFTIAGKPLSGDAIGDIPAQTYTGSAIIPAVVVKDGSKTLARDTDYIVSGTNNINAGSAATAIVTGAGNYAGSASRTFTINPKPLANSFIRSVSAQTYTGEAILPAVEVMDGIRRLVLNKDYTVSGSNHIDVGTEAVVTLTGIGNYTGSASATFTITAKFLSGDCVEAIPVQAYTGDSVKPLPVVRDGNRILTLGTDYRLEYLDNVNVGTAKLAVVPMGNYSGGAMVTFQIAVYTPPPGQIAADWIETIPAQTYTGDSLKPVLSVWDGNVLLSPGIHYSVAYYNNVDAGTATATVTGMGNYIGTASKTFTITPKELAAAAIDSIYPQTYSGDSLTPALTIRNGNKYLTADTDYAATYMNNINKGTATAIITGVGNYSGTVSKLFTINPKPITSDLIETIPAQAYTGSAIYPAITVRDGDKLLLVGVHYAFTYDNNINIGTASAIVEGLGNYTGTASKSFLIEDHTPAPLPIVAEWLEDIPAQTYSGDSLKPAVIVRDSAHILTEGVHYTLTYMNNLNAGTATATVTGMGNYSGTASKNFTIEPKQIGENWLGTIPAQTYTGDFLTPTITVWDGNIVLTAGFHYAVSCENNINAGIAIATVTGVGNYTGSASRLFTINPKPVAADWIADIPNQTFTGNYINPAPTVRDGNRTLTLYTDYTTGYLNNVNPGTATVTITGIGNYSGSASKDFLIGSNNPAPVPIAAGWIEDIPPQTYTGNALQPAITIRNGNTTLTPGTDYITAYSNNTNAGTAMITVTGVGYYSGTVYKYFTINPKPVSGSWIQNIPNQNYTGVSIQPAVTVMDGSRTLTPSTDYIVTYSNNVNAGTATIIITGIGNYTGTATGTFSIIRSGIPIDPSWVQVIPDQYYTGNPLYPAVIVTGLVQGVDYTVTYYNNVVAGTATALITGIGDYSGQIAQTFHIVSTGTEQPASAVLRITPAASDGLLVSGLTPGKTLSIYTLQGQLLYQATASSPEETIYLREKGIYILYHDGQYSKFSY
ncbi:MAG: Ig-like domain-containing protein [Bacteroidales bacterium]